MVARFEAPIMASAGPWKTGLEEPVASPSGSRLPPPLLLTPGGKEIPAPSTILVIRIASAQTKHIPGAAQVLDEFYRDDGTGIETYRLPESIH